MLRPRPRTLSAMCPPWPRLQTLSAMCPPALWLVSALAANLVSALCAASKPYPRHVRHVSGLCLSCVRFGAPPNLARHVIVSLWPRLQTLFCLSLPCARLVSPPNLVRHVSALCMSALTAPPNLARHVPAWLRHLVRHVSACGRLSPCLCRLWPSCVCHAVSALYLFAWCPPFPGSCVRCVSAVCVCVCQVSALCELCPVCVLSGSAIFALCVRHVSAPCLLFVLSLSACCSLCIRSLSTFVRVYALALAEPLSALCPLFDLCMVLGRALVCSVSSLVRLSRTLCLGIYFP